MSARHWIRFDGRGWYIPHGRITLDKGTSALNDVTCLKCLAAAEKIIFSMQGSLNAARRNLADQTRTPGKETKTT